MSDVQYSLKVKIPLIIDHERYGSLKPSDLYPLLGELDRSKVENSFPPIHYSVSRMPQNTALLNILGLEETGVARLTAEHFGGTKAIFTWYVKIDVISSNEHYTKERLSGILKKDGAELLPIDISISDIDINVRIKDYSQL